MARSCTSVARFSQNRRLILDIFDSTVVVDGDILMNLEYPSMIPCKLVIYGDDSSPLLMPNPLCWGIWVGGMFDMPADTTVFLDAGKLTVADC